MTETLLKKQWVAEPPTVNRLRKTLKNVRVTWKREGVANVLTLIPSHANKEHGTSCSWRTIFVSLSSCIDSYRSKYNTAAIWWETGLVIRVVTCFCLVKNFVAVVKIAAKNLFSQKNFMITSSLPRPTPPTKSFSLEFVNKPRFKLKDCIKFFTGVFFMEWIIVNLISSTACCFALSQRSLMFFIITH